MSKPDNERITRAVAAHAIDLANVKPGDIGVAHSRGIIGWLIRLGTHSPWNHAFIVESVPENPTPETVTVIQAEAHGVERALLSDVAPGGFIAILPCPEGVDPELVVAEAQTLLRTKYAFVSIVSIAMTIIARLLHVPWRFAVRDTSTLICSAVAALALLAGGWLHPWPDLYQVTPAQIADALSSPATPIPKRSNHVQSDHHS